MKSDIARLMEAVAFAAERHTMQRRKDAAATPYINHPIALANLITSVGGIDDLVVLQAALLHDTIEDTETTEDELRARFGAQVASVVVEVTDDTTLPKQRRKELQVEHAPRMSRAAALVKLADKICNLRDVASSPPAGWPIERRREYFDWAKRVVDRLPAVNADMLEAFQVVLLSRP